MEGPYVIGGSTEDALLLPAFEEPVDPADEPVALLPAVPSNDLTLDN